MEFLFELLYLVWPTSWQKNIYEGGTGHGKSCSIDFPEARISGDILRVSFHVRHDSGCSREGHDTLESRPRKMKHFGRSAGRPVTSGLMFTGVWCFRKAVAISLGSLVNFCLVVVSAMTMSRRGQANKRRTSCLHVSSEYLAYAQLCSTSLCIF